MSGLSEQEREVLLCDCDGENRDYCPAHTGADTFLDVLAKEVEERVERIVAAREAQVAERIAWVIETRNARCGSGSPYVEAYHDGYDDAREHMARIAREIGGQS